MHEAVQPVQSTDPIFIKKFDGSVETIFKKPDECFDVFKNMVIITPYPKEKIPVTLFDNDGTPVYAFKCNGYCFFDIYSYDDCSMIFDDEEEDLK